MLAAALVSRMFGGIFVFVLAGRLHRLNGLYHSKWYVPKYLWSHYVGTYTTYYKAYLLFVYWQKSTYIVILTVFQVTNIQYLFKVPTVVNKLVLSFGSWN